MKKLCVITGLFFLTITVFAQNPKVVSAYNYLKSGQLDKAKENIDAACIHPQTQGNAKTWLYRGNVYLAISATDDPKFKELHPSPLEEAYDAYQKSIAIDPEYAQPTASPASAQMGLLIIAEQHYNKGVELFNSRQYEKAIQEFDLTRKINGIFSIKDSLATYNAAICAIQIEDHEKAIQYLKELVIMSYMSPLVYSTLATLYKEQGDNDKALQVIKGGKTKFPNDLGILIAETNVYLATGDIEKAQQTLQIAVEKDPTNPILYFTVGSNYDQMTRKDSISDSDRAILLDNAIAAYEKAIELDPKYFDAYYNLGALYFNEGVRIFEAAQDILDMKVYTPMKEQYEAHWAKAIPYLESAHELLPNDVYTLQSLKTLYARLSMMDKLKDINEKIKALQE